MNGNAVKVAVFGDVSAIDIATLPRPYVVASGKFAETNEVGTTVAFPVKLTEAFVKNVFGCESGDIADTCTLAYAVHHLDTVAALCSVEFTFSQHQIYVGKAEEGEIGRVEDGVAIGGILFLIFVIVFRTVDKFDTDITLSLVS